MSRSWTIWKPLALCGALSTGVFALLWQGAETRSERQARTIIDLRLKLHGGDARPEEPEKVEAPAAKKPVVRVTQGRSSKPFIPAESVRRPARPQPPARTGVFINNQELSQAQVVALTRTYGQAPRRGRYWYDKRTGTYGVMGFPAWGFMKPGHDFGAMPRDASRGSTGVIFNGRELPLQEWVLTSQLLGTRINPGRYWLDARGNAGLEGNPTPLVNFYAAARQNQARFQAARSSAGRSGDNFWSSRFSAGNSDRGGSRGYVSVPGYGPVGYGFD